MSKNSKHFYTSEEEMNKKTIRVKPIVYSNPVLGRNQDLQKGNYINKCQRPTAAFVCSYLCFLFNSFYTIESQIHKIIINLYVFWLAMNKFVSRTQQRKERPI